MSGDASLIYRRYGKSYQSVDVDFDAMVFNDIGFRRNRKRRIPAEGPVQAETKQLLLDRLRVSLVELSGRLPEG